MENEKDNKGLYISAKTDKLAAALYMVTNQLSDAEPLKWKLRDLAIQSLVFKGNQLKNESTKILESLTSLLELAVNSGSVSVMNFNLLRNEYRALLETIELSHTASLRSSIIVKEVPALPEKTVEPIGHIPNHVTHVNNVNTNDKEMRQSLITKYVRGKGWTAIKDIAKAVPNCSVKTVQRELAELVDQGVLKKRGDRRWSRYMLAV